ncbi:transglutaminase domain-containing protein [Naumannella huperziae]
MRPGGEPARINRAPRYSSLREAKADKHVASSSNVSPTPILDFTHENVAKLARRALESASTPPPTKFLGAAHKVIAESIRPVYSVNEELPASRVIGRGFGSCSQRLAVLEAVARSAGIPTRARGFVVRGEFWRPRFRVPRVLMPREVLLCWPDFCIDDQWVTCGEIFCGPGNACEAQAFTNSGPETLFEAIRNRQVSWTKPGTGSATGDLSAWVIRDLGTFSSRDALWQAHNQTFDGVVLPIVDAALRLGSRAAGWGRREPSPGSRGRRHPVSPTAPRHPARAGCCPPPEGPG